VKIAKPRGKAPMLTLNTENAVADDSVMFDCFAASNGWSKSFSAILVKRMETNRSKILLYHIPNFRCFSILFKLKLNLNFRGQFL